MSDKADTVEALTKSVVALDSSRRVGWAKSFEAETRVDEAHRELNMARGDMAILSKFAAYAVGILQGLRFDSLLGPRYQGAVFSYLPDASRREGLERARHWLEENDNNLEQSLASKEARRRELKNENGRLWKNARVKERYSLMMKFGIPDEDCLMEWLGKYQKWGEILEP